MTQLEKYVDLIISGGVNLKRGQYLMINAPLDTAPFARLLQKRAYEAGAADVQIFWSDELSARNRYLFAEDAVLTDIPQWFVDSRMYYANKGGCAITIAAQDPDVFADVPAAKVAAAQRAGGIALKEYRELMMSSQLRWNVVSVPTAAWANKLFPGKSDEQAVEALWQAIFDTCRVSEPDPAVAWKAHIETLAARASKLNALRLCAVRMQSGNGTDLTVGLAECNKWAGGGDVDPQGVAFSPNIPTEEVFGAPHKDKVNGVVKSTMPLCYNGVMIEDFSFTFRDGRVVEYTARLGFDTLSGILDSDEGAKRLGEFAIVPFDSPVAKTGITFLNTLFDENASCHLALGKGYPDNIDIKDANEQTLAAHGLNDSVMHVDFMVGATDTRLTGITADGVEVVFFDKGRWMI